MGVHDDLAARAVVASAAVAWTRRDGVDEKLLEELDASRHTAIVWLPPGGALPAVAASDIARDVLVLDGEAREGGGTYAAGWYVRTRGAMHSARGCMLFVKQRLARRAVHHAVDTRGVAFEPTANVGVVAATVHRDLDGHVVLFRVAPRAQIQRHRHDGCEELFVIGGAVTDEYGTYEQHTWVRQPPGSVHALVSETGGAFLALAHSVEHAHHARDDHDHHRHDHRHHGDE